MQVVVVLLHVIFQ